MFKTIKAIIIAAGIGSRLKPLTNDKPKCLLEIAGKSILEHQIDILKSCGIIDISVIKGYQKEKINYPNLKYYINDNYQNNNILSSLFYAEREMNNEFIVMYSDILFDRSVIEKLLKSKNDISVVVDTDWVGYYDNRTEHPIEEAENVVIHGEKVIKIGKHLTAQESNGEFIGMAKFTEKGGQIFKREFQRVKNSYSGMPFQKSKTFGKAYLTDIFQELVDQGIEVCSVNIQKNWWEIDTQQDFEKVKKIFSS